MSEISSIEWTDAIWNPVRGCTKISPGCKHCYAETFAERFRGVPGHPYEQGFGLRIVPESLNLPLKWRTPKKIFVNSMSDLFHKDVTDDYIVEVTDVMARASWHTFQVLTKRSERLRDMLKGPLREFSKLKWIQWGVSVEDKKYGVPRIAHLQAAPAAVWILSVEPLLEDIGKIDLMGIGWVIVGGESGRGCRPMQPEWARSLRDQCLAARVPFFFKQWGGFPKAKAGRELDGRTWGRDALIAKIAMLRNRPTFHRLLGCRGDSSIRQELHREGPDLRTARRRRPPHRPRQSRPGLAQPEASCRDDPCSQRRA